MISLQSKTEYCFDFDYNKHGCYYLADYIAHKEQQDFKLNFIIILFLISLLITLIGFSRPIFANAISPPINREIITENLIYQQNNFEDYIRNKYPYSHICFISSGIAHIKKVKYINQKPIKINIVEINTNINPNIRIKPQLPNSNINSKATVRKIAQKDNALIAINGGFFKPATGTPLGALMINEKIITGPIFNRVGLVIFEEKGKLSFKLEKIVFNLTAKIGKNEIKIDNINQPRMLSTHLIAYNSLWGNYSPVAPKHCYNLLISDNKAVKVSANPIAIAGDDVVLQGPKEQIVEIIKQEKDIEIKQELPRVLKGAKHIIGAGPYLLKDGQIFVDTEVQKLNAISGKNPRSAVGFDDKGNFIIVTIDGREKASVGMTLLQLANLMKSIGCRQAMNFDGGSSSAMYVKGKIINDAPSKEGIAVSNALNVLEINSDEVQISSIK